MQPLSSIYLKCPLEVFWKKPDRLTQEEWLSHSQSPGLFESPPGLERVAVFGGGCWRNSSDCEGGRLTSAAQVAEEIERPYCRSDRAPNVNADTVKPLIFCVYACVCLFVLKKRIFSCFVVVYLLNTVFFEAPLSNIVHAMGV